MEENRHDVLTDKFGIHFFELKKLNKSRKNKPVEVWLDLINAETEGDLEMIEAETQVKDIHDIIFKVREMSADEKIRYQAEMREKALLDEESAMRSSRRQGFEFAVSEMRANGASEEMIQNIIRSFENSNKR